jgi:hypothetical protein
VTTPPTMVRAGAALGAVGVIGAELVVVLGASRAVGLVLFAVAVLGFAVILIAGRRTILRTRRSALLVLGMIVSLCLLFYGVNGR